MSRFGLDVIGAAGFGQAFGAIQHPDTPLLHHYAKAFGASKGFFLMATIFPQWLLHYIPIRAAQDVMTGTRIIKEHCAQIISRKREAFERSIERGESGEMETGIDIIGVLMRNGAFNDEDLVNQAMTFLGAGHETAAASLTWALFALSQPRHRHIQERLRMEIRNSLSNPATSGSSITVERLESLRYLNAVTCEVLRLYAPAPYQLRENIKDVVLNGMIVPKGTEIRLCALIYNQRQDFWGHDSEMFDPERWLVGERSQIGGASDAKNFFSFSAGNRRCPGEEFVRAEFKTVLAGLVGNFDFSIPKDKDMKDVEVDYVLTTMMVGGLDVKVRAIESWA